MNKAFLLKDNLAGTYRGHAALYRMEPPHEGHELVIVSAVNTDTAYETYLFPGDASGKITDYAELSGSIKGTTDHAKALAEASYEIVTD